MVSALQTDKEDDAVDWTQVVLCADKLIGGLCRWEVEALWTDKEGGVDDLSHYWEVVEPLKPDRGGIADKEEVEVAYTRKGDNIADRIDLEEVVVHQGKHNAAPDAASPDHFCYHHSQMVHLKLHLGLVQEHPFFEDPSRDKMPSPAEAVEEY